MKCKNCIYFNEKDSTCMIKNNQKVDGKKKLCKDGK